MHFSLEKRGDIRVFIRPLKFFGFFSFSHEKKNSQKGINRFGLSKKP